MTFTLTPTRTGTQRCVEQSGLPGQSRSRLSAAPTPGGGKKRVSRSGRPIDLGPTEYRFLEFLMERPGRVFTREQLLNGIWGQDVYIDERTVDVHVGRLRKAINRGKEADPIPNRTWVGLWA